MTTKKPTHQDLIKLDKYPNYYVNPISGKITWRGSVKSRRAKIATGTNSIKEAKKVVEEKLLIFLSNNPDKERRERKGIQDHLIKDVWADLIEERFSQKSPATLLSYNTSWKMTLEPFWGNLAASSITPGQVKKFENWYLKKFPTRVFFNTAKHLRMLLNYCHRTGYISIAPKLSDLDEIIKTKSKRKDVGRVYTNKEIEGIIEFSDQRTALAVRFARYMGMRKMEILSLKLENIDTKSWIANVWSSKNKHWRTVPIPDNVKKEYLAYISELRPKQYLFEGVKDKTSHISGQVFDKGWTRAKSFAGISNWNVENAARFHDLRHTFATQTAVDNWPPMVACEVLDMSLKEYQRTYVHISKNDVRLMMNKSFGGHK